MIMKKVTILGSTGSIGTQALDVIGRNREKFQIETLSCGRNTALFEKQIQAFSPKQAVTALEEDAVRLAKAYPKTEFLWGEEGLLAAAGDSSEILLN